MKRRWSLAAAAVGQKPAQDVFGGRYAGDIAERDGRLRKVAWHPHCKLADDGSIQSPRRA